MEKEFLAIVGKHKSEMAIREKPRDRTFHVVYLVVFILLVRFECGKQVRRTAALKWRETLQPVAQAICIFLSFATCAATAVVVLLLAAIPLTRHRALLSCSSKFL